MALLLEYQECILADSVNFDVPGLASSSNPIDLTLFGLYPGIGYRFRSLIRWI